MRSSRSGLALVTGVTGRPCNDPHLMFAWFDRHREYGALFIRIVVGVILIEGTADNVFNWERMKEFEKFLAANGLPMPLLGAILSAYGQFICGFLILIGAATRFASIVMIINFIFALWIGHRVGGFAPARLALCMLFSSAFLLFHGAGRPSVDAWLASRKRLT